MSITKPPTIYLATHPGSRGRGIGYYQEFLTQALKQIPGITLTTHMSKSVDLVHYPYFDLFYPTLPLLKAKPTIVTIHDLTPLVLSPLYPKGIRGTLNLARQRLSLLNVSSIITDSHASQVDIAKLFKIPLPQIYPIPLAVDPHYATPPSTSLLKKVKAKYNLPDKFILTVAGGPNPNKNLPQLAQATQVLNLPLVIVGSGLLQTQALTSLHPELRDLRLLTTYKHLILPGFVPTPELNAIYHLAALYCQASFYEGFGLPLLEAMTAGCLVVSSSTSSLPEIYSPSTITFNPYDLNSILNSLELALNLPSSKKKLLIANNKLQAQNFTWEKTASLTASVYRSVLSPA